MGADKTDTFETQRKGGRGGIQGSESDYAKTHELAAIYSRLSIDSPLHIICVYLQKSAAKICYYKASGSFVGMLWPLEEGCPLRQAIAAAFAIDHANQLP